MTNSELKALTIEELETSFKEAGIPRFRAGQVLSWVYGKSCTSYEEMTNIPKTMREQLDAAYPLYVPTIRTRHESKDGTRKYLLEYHDGALVETVGIPSNDGRLTVCASSQSGCAMGCVFCATGKLGLTRDLLPGEVVDQISVVQDDFGQRVSNVVVMGQGEPFANYRNTLSALKILNNPKLFNIGARRITVSTCGLIDGIKRFSREPEQYTLAVSLHSAVQNTRDQIMPAMKKQNLESLRMALQQYTEVSGRRFTFEYALMNSVNDSSSDLDALIQYAQGLLCHVNLIPLNHVAGSPIRPSSHDTLHYWEYKLNENGITASIRKSRGSDIVAACGQLASLES